MRRRGAVLRSAAAVAALACSGGGDATGPAPTPPQTPPPPAAIPGWVTFSLETPNGDEAGVIVTVLGGPVDSVESVGGHTVYSVRRTADLRLLLRGRISRGPLLRLRVPDISAASSYTARLDQAAAGAPSYVMRDLAVGYELVRSDP